MGWGGIMIFDKRFMVDFILGHRLVGLDLPAIYKLACVKWPELTEPEFYHHYEVTCEWFAERVEARNSIVDESRAMNDARRFDEKFLELEIARRCPSVTEMDYLIQLENHNTPVNDNPVT
jgi:hypothetical protein